MENTEEIENTTSSAPEETGAEAPLSIQQIFEKHFGPSEEEGPSSRSQAMGTDGAEQPTGDASPESGQEAGISTQVESQKTDAPDQTSKINEDLERLTKLERKARADRRRLETLAKSNPVALLRELAGDDVDLSELATDAAYESLGDDAPDEHKLKQLERRMAREKASQEAEKSLEQEEANRVAIETYTNDVSGFLEREIGNYTYLSAAYGVNPDGVVNEVLNTAAQFAKDMNRLPGNTEIDLAALEKQAAATWGPIVDALVEQRLRGQAKEEPSGNATPVVAGQRRPSGGATKQTKPKETKLSDVISKWSNATWGPQR